MERGNTKMTEQEILEILKNHPETKQVIESAISSSARIESTSDGYTGAQQPVINVSVNPVITTSSSHSEKNSLKDMASLMSALLPLMFRF